MSNTRYLIVLTGGGDTEVTLTLMDAKTWIEKPFRSGSSSCKEAVPKALLKAYPAEIEERGLNKPVTITCGSYDNDRAMFCPGDRFDTAAQALKYAKKNKLEIVDQYHGYLY